MRLERRFARVQLRVFQARLQGGKSPADENMTVRKHGDVRKFGEYFESAQILFRRFVSEIEQTIMQPGIDEKPQPVFLLKGGVAAVFARITRNFHKTSP